MMQHQDLKTILKGSDSIKKSAALILLWEKKIEFPLLYLHKALQDKDKDLRSTAAFILSKRGTRNSVKYLVAAWNRSGKTDIQLKRQILIALQDIAGVNGMNKIIESFPKWDISLQNLAADYVSAVRQERGRSFFIDVIARQKLTRKTRSILESKKILHYGK